MTSARKPANENERLCALRSYELLDTACEFSLDGVVNLAARLTGASGSMISLVDADRQWFKARFAIDQLRTARDEAFCAHAILEPDRTLVVRDTLDDPRFADNPMVRGEPRIRFYAGQPLVNPDGYALGTLCVVDPQPRDLSDDQRDSLKVLADALMTTLEFRRLSRIDPLTGLSNRTAFMSALDRALGALRADARSFGLLYLDLDGFKRLNDSRGHDAGDQLLREVAFRLSRIVRQEDMVARIGGDEFAVLLMDGSGLDAPAERIRAQLVETMRERGWAVTVSIGAISMQAASLDGLAALKEADRALYAAKRGGRNRVVHRLVPGQGPELAPIG